MNKWFDLNGPLMTWLSKAADLVILSALWFVCCIPVITIGAATAAMYCVTLKLAREEDVKITACFFRSLKQNLKQGIVLTLIFLVLGVILFADYFIMSGVEGTVGMVCSVAFLVMGIWLLCVAFYTFPLQAQFENPIIETLKNAFFLSSQKLGTTAFVFVLNMVPVIVACVSLQAFVLAAPVWALVTPGLSAYLCAGRFAKLFAPYLEPAENETEV